MYIPADYQEKSSNFEVLNAIQGLPIWQERIQDVKGWWCQSLPKESKGECWLAWYNFIISSGTGSQPASPVDCLKFYMGRKPLQDIKFHRSHERKIAIDLIFHKEPERLPGASEYINISYWFIRRRLGMSSESSRHNLKDIGVPLLVC